MKWKIRICIIIYSILIFLIVYRLRDFVLANFRHTNITIDSLKVIMIKTINKERASNNVPPVHLDSVAGISAEYHANEMKEFNFFSHYSINGIPPYIRYSLRNGGKDAMGENIALGINYQMLKIGPIRIKGKIDTRNIIIQLNRKMYNEKAPHNGHRKTILNKHYTGVGIGIAYNDTLLFYVETFTGHYIKLLNSVPDTTMAGNAVSIFAQLIYDSLKLDHIEVYYDSIPRLLTKEKRFYYDPRNSYSYSNNVSFYMPTDHKTTGLFNNNNTIEIYGNHFYGDIFTNRKGFYTIVPIISDGKELFEGANISLFAK